MKKKVHIVAFPEQFKQTARLLCRYHLDGFGGPASPCASRCTFVLLMPLTTKRSECPGCVAWRTLLRSVYRQHHYRA